MEAAQPLSLQQHCFLYLLAHLEEIPPASLALLPRRMRHELLLILPTADILLLEHTGVVDGINMDKVWEVESTLPAYPSISQSCTPKKPAV